jgi:hypothetical protein
MSADLFAATEKFATRWPTATRRLVDVGTVGFLVVPGLFCFAIVWRQPVLPWIAVMASMLV